MKQLNQDIIKRFSNGEIMLEDNLGTNEELIRIIKVAAPIDDHQSNIINGEYKHKFYDIRFGRCIPFSLYLAFPP